MLWIVGTGVKGEVRAQDSIQGRGRTMEHRDAEVAATVAGGADVGFHL
ncbi:MAG: hypothetical protein HY561_04345 [Gemmatimonadetes bacterium]|nr:hypothetical protein [Gemmatimonadota bacterium]